MRPKKILAAFLALVMTLSVFVYMPKEVQATTAHTRSEAKAWIDAAAGQYWDYDNSWGAQCVDLIMCYYDYLGVAPSSGNACDYAYDYNPLPDGWQRIAYYDGFVAMPGDIVVWYGPYSLGHIALVSSADATNMYVVENNADGTATGNASTNTYAYNDSFMNIFGVIRPDFPAEAVIPDREDKFLDYYFEVEPVREGDTQINVNLMVDLPEDATGYELGQFAIDMSYDPDVMQLSDFTWHAKGYSKITSEYLDIIPFMIVWVSISRSEQFAAGPNVIAEMTFDLTHAASAGSVYEIDIESNPENDMASMESRDGTYPEIYYTEEDYSFTDAYITVGNPGTGDGGLDNPDTDDPVEDEVYVYLDYPIDSLDAVANDFILGGFFTDHEYLLGYAEAKAFQSKSEWLKYDAIIILAIADDELSDEDRYINLVYANKNGLAEDIQYLSFGYDVAERRLYLAEGLSNSGEYLADPVYIDLDTDSGEYIDLGISVDEGRIRCFCNSMLVFDYENPDMHIADSEPSNFLFWQTGNFVQISDIVVTSPGYIFPYDVEYPEAPVVTGISVASAPEKTTYPIGGTLDTAGLSINIEYSDGTQRTVTDGFTVEGYDFSTAGTKTITVTYLDFLAQFEVYVDADLVEYPESDHPYGTNSNSVWYYTHKEAANYLAVTFSSDTYVESDFDHIYIYDADGNEIDSYTGSELSGETIYIPGNSFSVKLTSDGNICEYGFSITNIEALDAIPEFEIIDGVLVNYIGLGGDVVIPDSVTSIGGDAFYYCHSLTSVTIPDSVTSIGDRAFYNCYSLTSVTIGNGVTSIGGYAFYNCYSLTSVTIPDSVTNIGYYAFWYCGSLMSITIPDSVNEIGHNAFDLAENGKIYCYEDSHAHAYAIVYDIPYVLIQVEFDIDESGILTRYLGDGGDVIIPDGVTMIGAQAFAFNNDITSVVIPEGVTTIEKGAFTFCENLETVVLPATLESIGDGAFAFCYALSDLELPESVTTLGNGAFGWCTSLGETYIHDGVAAIGDDVFEGCESLTLRFYDTAPMADYAVASGVNYRLILRGDVDDNGMVNSADATVLGRSLAGASVETKYGADYNRDGVVNSADLTVLRRMLAGADV